MRTRTEPISSGKSLIAKSQNCQRCRLIRRKHLSWLHFDFETRSSNHYFSSWTKSTSKLRNLIRTPQSPLSHYHRQSPHILCQSQAQICPTVLCQEYRAREYKQTALFSMEINKSQLFYSQVKSLSDYSEYEWLDKCLRLSLERSTLCLLLHLARKNVSQTSLCPAF